jgi:hypothetical protein
MIETKLIAALLALAALVGAYLYVAALRHSITALKEEAVTLTEDRDKALAQVKELTTARDEVKKKQALAEAATATARSELAKARAAVRYIEIPGECPAKLDWLFKEVEK